MKILLVFVFCMLGSFIDAQNYAVSSIPSEMKQGMYAVKHIDNTRILLKDYDDMVFTKKQVITVFNERAWQNLRLRFGVPYDSYDKISAASAIIYDAAGQEVKKIKKRDFLDVSPNSADLYNDDRLLYLDYVPSFYPFTIAFEYEIETSNTAWLPPFYPMSDDEISVVNTTYQIENTMEIQLKKRWVNLDTFKVIVSESPSKVILSASNLIPKPFERMAEDVSSYFPIAQFAPKKFSLKGVPATVETWDDFANWQLEKLLKGQDDISEQTILRINDMVSAAKTPKDKARLIYEYMQEKTRYISIQVGIGGWKPMAASKVDNLGYGDCKGLTNYTKALLKSQGIESYYTIVNALENGKDIDEDYVALQGNHVILAIPFEDELTFLECTSQTYPFGFLGTHTDDREVLMITPEGGKITKTTRYLPEENLQKSNGKFVLDEQLKLKGDLQIASTGLSYGKRFEIPSLKENEIRTKYKKDWSYHRNIYIDSLGFKNDKENIVFTEYLKLNSNGIISKAGDKLLFTPNLFNQWRYQPKNYKTRNQPFKVRRGYSFEDTIEFQFPKNYEIASVFEPFELTTEFGTYQISATVDKTSNTLVYYRKFLYTNGEWSNESYKDYFDFCKTINKMDKQKILLNKIN